jgi:hypothetical protein
LKIDVILFLNELKGKARIKSYFFLNSLKLYPNLYAISSIAHSVLLPICTDFNLFSSILIVGFALELPITEYDKIYRVESLRVLGVNLFKIFY